MPRPASWHSEAFNQVPDSQNRIHSDEVARQHGFEGGLVPGVTVSAYLLHPAVEAWGEEWLARGRSTAVVSKPLYDRRKFRVEVENAGEIAFDGRLVDEVGTECATAHAELPEAVPAPPERRGDRLAGERPPVAPTPEGMAELRERGMDAICVRWEPTHPMSSYLRDASAMPELLRADGGGFANSAFVLGVTNWHVAANVDLGPWLHLQTESQHFRPLAAGTEVVAEGRVVDLFEKKGHHFVDVDVGLFVRDSAAARIRLRAIYRLRGS